MIRSSALVPISAPRIWILLIGVPTLFQVIALLDYMFTEINCACMVYLPLISHLQPH